VRKEQNISSRILTKSTNKYQRKSDFFARHELPATLKVKELNASGKWIPRADRLQNVFNVSMVE